MGMTAKRSDDGRAKKPARARGTAPRHTLTARILELRRVPALAGQAARPGRGGPDAIRERAESPKVRPGQLWAMGEHRLVCGDARSTEHLATLMGQGRADVLWTDPPYGVSYQGKTARRLR